MKGQINPKPTRFLLRIVIMLVYKLQQSRIINHDSATLHLIIWIFDTANGQPVTGCESVTLESLFAQPPGAVKDLFFDFRWERLGCSKGPWQAVCHYKLRQCDSDRMTTRPTNTDAKTGDDTEHKLAHAIVFIISICCLLIAGAGYIRLFLLEPARLTKTRPTQVSAKWGVHIFAYLHITFMLTYLIYFCIFCAYKCIWIHRRNTYGVILHILAYFAYFVHIYAYLNLHVMAYLTFCRFQHIRQI